MQSCKNRVRELDAMAIPVGLTYNGSKEFATLFGGCVTLLVVIVIGSLSIDNIIDCFTKPVYITSTTALYQDLTKIPSVTLDTKHNILASRLSLNAFNEGIGEQVSWIDQAARIQFYSITRDSDGAVSNTWISSVYCSEKYADYPNFVQDDGAFASKFNFVCPDVDKFTLENDFFTDDIEA